MLVDINSYIGHWPLRRLRGNTLGFMLQRMDKFDVDKSVVANINGIFYKRYPFSEWENSSTLS